MHAYVDLRIPILVMYGAEPGGAEISGEVTACSNSIFTSFLRAASSSTMRTVSPQKPLPSDTGLAVPGASAPGRTGLSRTGPSQIDTNKPSEPSRGEQAEPKALEPIVSRSWVAASPARRFAGLLVRRFAASPARRFANLPVRHFAG